MNFTDWSEEITKNLKQAQEQYWKSMAEQRAKAEGNQTSDIPHMTEGLERLWSILGPQMPKQADDVMKQVFGMGKSRDQFSDNFSAIKDVVNSLAESQLHSFGIPTKKAQEELLKQVEELTLQNAVLKERIIELEADAAKHEQATEPKKEFKATATRVSKPAGVKKVAKSAAKKAATQSKPDDLTQIVGIGPVIKDKLIAAGIKTFKQLGKLTTKQAQALDNELGLKGRLLRDDWVGQAAKFAAER